MKVANFLPATVMLMLLGAACAGPPYVQELNIANPTDYDVVVDLMADGSSSRLALGIVPKGETALREQVLDPGEQWTFRFHYNGNEAGEASVARAQLQEAGWRFTIPPEVGERLRAAGVPPSL
ncbi:MAG: hypothetical protein ACT4OM_12795 [Actinomycetota bacterium]